ncbi:MAG: Nif3-like dinuclear metal center hexameric protein [Methylococcales bacterium]|jgi:dinuclear metal center YbgI/SA1388 family protein|nr:Nif3-like dinuclear metal center hexameric protein [Methylococcales bacterium]MBT7409507.1 Nif3-like dinuclear metal center hexameric protein [Methylococcales bacterium]
MISNITLHNYLNDLFDITQYKDYCPNGCQLEGKTEINKIITGVTACQALLDRAVEKNADAIIVHHGYFWKSENPTITGMKYQRIKTLINNEINLFAYHLPLDGHHELGNNVQLGQLLDIKIDPQNFINNKSDLLFFGELSEALSPEKFKQQIHQKLSREPLLIQTSDKTIKKVVWCTGAAQTMIEQARDMNVDAFISGEISEQTVHQARELGIHYYSAGHHATEKLGVMALADHLDKQLSVHCEFIDIDNPV